ncbi:MAG: TolC family protein, partial [Planctomycetes bacterium]|nr:TolC family protein [Planctomycetota bacterium]
GFTLPLFHGNGAQIEHATAARAAAAAVVEATQTRAITDAAAALDQFARQRRELAAATALAASTAAALAMARQRADLGADDQGAVIAAAIDDLDARTALLQQQHGARSAWLRLELALQQPVGEGLLAWQCAVPEMAP